MKPLDDRADIIEKANDALDKLSHSSHWSQYNQDIITGYYEISEPVYSAENFQKLWVHV